MGYGLTNHLLALAGMVFLASAAIAWRRLPFVCAAPIAFVRVLAPLMYFAWYFDGQWNFLDDLSYFEHGEYLVQRGYSPLCIFTEEGREMLRGQIDSSHIFYPWWNLLTMWLFGSYYYVPVFVNVLVTFGSAHLFARLLEEIGLPSGYQRTLQVCYLLHWDTIAWSSFVNLKDILVQFLTICFFLCAVRAVKSRRRLDLAWCCGIVLVFQYLRFYVPFIVGAAAAAWLFLEWRDFRKFPLLAGALLVGLWLLPGHAYRLFESHSIIDFVYGICRFSLTPQPWDIRSGYSFLLLPATFHWLMAAPAFFGGAMLWRDSRAARVVLLYAVILIVMYSLADEIQGVRQRSQLSFVFLWSQAHFLWRWTHTPATGASTVPARPRPRPSIHAPVFARD